MGQVKKSQIELTSTAADPDGTSRLSNLKPYAAARIRTGRTLPGPRVTPNHLIPRSHGASCRCPELGALHHPWKGAARGSLARCKESGRDAHLQVVSPRISW